MSENDERKDYSGKVSESGIMRVFASVPSKIKISVENINDISEQLIEASVIFDYVNFKPDYDRNDDEWWYFDEKEKIIHVLIENAAQDSFVDTLKKMENGSELTEQEEAEAMRYQIMKNRISRRAVERLICTYNYGYKSKVSIIDETDPTLFEREEDTKKAYRTRAKVKGGVSDALPLYLALITNAQYKESLSLREQREGSYLVPSVLSADDMVYDGTTLFIKGCPASEANLREINKDKNVPIEKIDLPLLRMFYSIILSDFVNNAHQFGVVNETVTVYVPDLAELLGKGRNIGKKDIEAIIKKAASFQTICGVLKDPKRPNGIGTVLPLLLWQGYYEDTNTIRFQSPYMTELIMRIYDVSVRRDKLGTPKLKKDGTPILEASHSYLVKSSIVKERNKRAAEIVMVVVATIEQSGNRTPHLKARTIIERIPQLQEAYENTTQGNKNRVLMRAFKKAWELLETQTKLREKYPTIVLPDPKDPKNIPTTTTLDKVFEFPHK